MAANPIFPGVIKNWVARILNADATNFVTLATAGATGSKIDTISATNTDTANGYTLQFAISVGGVDYIIGEVPILAFAGTGQTTSTNKAHDCLNVIDMPWLRSEGLNRYLLLATGSTLKVKAKSTVAGANVVALVAQGGDF